MLSDELRRAETVSGAVWRTLKAIWKPAGHLRIFLANLRVLLGICTLQIPSSRHLTIFCLRTFISTKDFCTRLQQLRSSFHAMFPMVNIFNASRILKARIPMPQRIMRLLPPILTTSLFLSLLFLISPLARREGLEPHMVPRRLRRLQRNVRYHLDNDL